MGEETALGARRGARETREPRGDDSLKTLQEAEADNFIGSS